MSSLVSLVTHGKHMYFMTDTISVQNTDDFWRKCLNGVANRSGICYTILKEAQSASCTWNVRNDSDEVMKMLGLPWVKIGLFAGGVLFGTAGVKLLSSKDAKKVYTHTTAAVLRAKDCVMETVTAVKENCEDILTDAKEINEQRAVEEEDAMIADAWEDAADEDPAAPEEAQTEE